MPQLSGIVGSSVGRLAHSARDSPVRPDHRENKTMRLSERYRPRTLSDVCGQPCISRLKGFCLRPFNGCWLFEGPAGTGKTGAAYAMAADLGADPAFGILEYNGADLSVETTREMLRLMQLRPLCGQWLVVIIDELERLHPTVQGILKERLESRRLPPHVVVIATSNDPSALSSALLQRFLREYFRADSKFADAANERIAAAWLEIVGSPIAERGWGRWGFENGSNNAAGNPQFSFRVAWDCFQKALLRQAAEVACA